MVSFRMVFSYLVATGWILASSHVRIQSIESIKYPEHISHSYHQVVNAIDLFMMCKVAIAALAHCAIYRSKSLLRFLSLWASI